MARKVKRETGSTRDGRKVERNLCWKLWCIKEEEDNGMRLKWEETYRQLLDVMKGAEASEVDEEDNDIVEVDYSMLYEDRHPRSQGSVRRRKPRNQS